MHHKRTSADASLDDTSSLAPVTKRSSEGTSQQVAEISEGQIVAPAAIPDERLILIDPDPYTPEAHDKLDELCRPLTTPGSSAMTLYVIMTAFNIAEPGVYRSDLVESYEACASLLALHPNLGEYMSDVLKTTPRKFSNLRLLKCLRPDTARDWSNSPAASGNKQATVAAWNVAYKKEYHRLLYNNIKAMHRAVAYANMASIIQSSGTGKSRMVQQLGKLVFTIPFNLRESNAQGSYPRADDDIRDLLVPAKELEEQEARVLVYSFFKATFEEALSYLRSPSTLAEGDTVLMGWWNRMECDDRTVRLNAYKRIAKKACPSPQNSPHLRDGTKGVQHEASAVVDPVEQARKLSEDTKIVLTELIEEIGKHVSDVGSVKLVIYMDEAHTLADKNLLHDRTKSQYDIVCSCFADFYHLPAFILFLSTSSRFETLAPVSELIPSSRGVQKTVQPPITELPFDVNVDISYNEADLTLAEVVSLGSMTQYGRPIWSAMFESFSRKTTPYVEREMIEFARRKLVSRMNIDQVDTKSGHGDYATLDVRLNFEYNGTFQLARDVQSTLVASNVRLAYIIPQSRGFLLSGYPSEPILAEAAAQQTWVLRHRYPNERNAPLKALSSCLTSGLIELGERGELAARFVLMTAYDRAVEYENPVPEREEPLGIYYSRGCHLTTFIRELFCEEHANRILGGVPDNIAHDGQTFSEAFKDAVVRFTHFDRLESEEPLSALGMYGAFCRGFAAIARRGQKRVDLAIPVLMNKGKAVTDDNMSVILIQVKRRQQSEAKVKTIIDAKDVSFFDSGNSHPYMSLVMEMGIACNDHVDVSFPPANRDRRGDTSAADTVTHPRYAVFAYGCSHEIYKVISETDEESWETCLRTRPFREHHARQDQSSLKAILAMMPAHYWKASGYTWAPNRGIR